MKILIYYLALLVLIVLLTGFLVQPQQNAMTMATKVSISLFLGLYVVAMSFVGEGKIIAGTIVLSIGVLYQVYSHRLDYWLLAGLIVINLMKIISLIYSHYKN